MLFAALQKVELVGGESWWSHNAGSLLVALAAIGAASLAAYVSVRNHKQQLAYDRSIRDRDAIRESIDQAVRGITELVLQGVTFSGHLHTLEGLRASLGEANEDAALRAHQEKQVEQTTKAIQEVVPLVSAAINSAHADGIHLSIRLGETHPVARTQMKTREALKAWILQLNKALPRNRTSEELEAAGDSQKEIGTTRSAFESACFAWLNDGA